MTCQETPTQQSKLRLTLSWGVEYMITEYGSNVILSHQKPGGGNMKSLTLTKMHTQVVARLYCDDYHF